MEDIKKWSLDYCASNNITYEELVEKALDLYRSYNDNNMTLYKYITSSEFRNVLQKTNKLLIDNDTSFFVKVITTKEGKKAFMNTLESSKSNYKYILSKEQTEIIIIQNRNENVAFAIASYESENNELGSYAFLHYVEITKDDFIKHYRKIEKEICQYLSQKGYNYYDRIITSDLETGEYELIYDLYNINLSLVNNYSSNLKYTITENELLNEDYDILAQRVPKRFNFPLTTAIKRVQIENGSDFYMHISQKIDSALLLLMVAKDKRDNKTYLETVFNVSLEVLSSLGIKEVYITLQKNHTMIKNQISKFKIVSNEKWIRKIL